MPYQLIKLSHLQSAGVKVRDLISNLADATISAFEETNKNIESMIQISSEEPEEQPVNGLWLKEI